MIPTVESLFGTPAEPRRETLRERADRMKGGGMSFREIAAAEGMEFMDFMNAYEGNTRRKRARHQPRPRPAAINRAKPGVKVVFVEPKRI